MVTETTEVRVTRLRVRLLKVEHPGGYQLVLGGRLLLEAKDGQKVPHSDIPEYVPAMFPVPYSEWAYADDSESCGVKVTLVEDNGKERELGTVRACTMLFTPVPRDVATAWLRSKKGGAK